MSKHREKQSRSRVEAEIGDREFPKPRGSRDFLKRVKEEGDILEGRFLNLPTRCSLHNNDFFAL